MRFRTRSVHLPTLACGLVLLGAGAAHADCQNPKDQAETSKCLGADLQQSDKTINDTYGKLKASLGDADKVKLRDTQRAWIKERDKVCNINETITDRQKWLDAILKEPAKAVCVTRYTKQREAVLSASLQSNTMQSEPTASDGLYDIRSTATHKTGKWYFEVQLDATAIAVKKEIQISVGAIDPTGEFGMSYLISLRHGSHMTGTHTIGVAVDLDSGLIYSARDGEWTATPGSSGGDAIKLNHVYAADVGTSADMTDIKDLINVNFGDKRFTYAVPAGYRGFGK